MERAALLTCGCAERLAKPEGNQSGFFDFPGGHSNLCTRCCQPLEPSYLGGMLTLQFSHMRVLFFYLPSSHGMGLMSNPAARHPAAGAPLGFAWCDK